MLDHETILREILSSTTTTGKLKSRESYTVEYKESFNFSNAYAYAKTMAAFANNRGGYIIFGIKDSPRIIKGLQNSNFDNFAQERFVEIINTLFAPEILWDCGMFSMETTQANYTQRQQKRIAWIYTSKSEYRPVIAQKDHEKIASGDIFYRYRARTQKIKYPELHRIIEERASKEREATLRILDIIRKEGSANLGIINYRKGKLSTPYGVDITVDRKLVTKILRKAKFIKEGSFNEVKGNPVLKVTGTIDLAEEVPVPEGNPDETHPYIQKQLAEKLKISTQRLYALIWKFKMKENKVYHLEITTSRSGKTHKFSEYALNFLREKVRALESAPETFDQICEEYRLRRK